MCPLSERSRKKNRKKRPLAPHCARSLLRPNTQIEGDPTSLPMHSLASSMMRPVVVPSATLSTSKEGQHISLALSVHLSVSGSFERWTHQRPAAKNSGHGPKQRMQTDFLRPNASRVPRVDWCTLHGDGHQRPWRARLVSSGLWCKPKLTSFLPTSKKNDAAPKKERRQILTPKKFRNLRCNFSRRFLVSRQNFTSFYAMWKPGNIQLILSW